MDEESNGQNLGKEKKKPIMEQWAVSPIHYMGTDKLPAVRAGAALNKSKLTTPPWPYLKYSFPTSPSPASIKLHLLRIQVAHLTRALHYSLAFVQKYVLHTESNVNGGSDRVTS